MFAFEVEYLLGRVFAGDFQDRSRAEWPPHPARLFSALAAAYFENGSDPREKAALEWLEGQNPPRIRAGVPGDADVPLVYVPTNYAGDGPPATRGKQPRYFPAQGPSEATVYFVWPEAVSNRETTEALDQLASRTAYLGKACSVVRMRVADKAPEPNYAPDSSGRFVLRVPAPGRLEELGRLFIADQRISAGTQQRYRRIDEGGDSAAPAHSEFGQMVIFQKAGGPGLPIEATLTLTDSVRRALMSNAATEGPITDLIHGHAEGTHCAILGLPFVARKYADGHLMGFAVVIPRATSPEDRRAVLAACAELAQRGLHLAALGDWGLEAADEMAVNQTLRPLTWTTPSQVWKSVTPILLDRFPKKNGPTVEGILAESCRRIGLPEPVFIEHGPYSDLEGVPPVTAFRLQRGREERPRWAVHARIQFPLSVRGPVLLGAGRYFGLGLMRPEKEGGHEQP